MIRWRMPPENSCGWLRTRVRGMPTDDERLAGDRLGLVVLDAGPVGLQLLDEVVDHPHQRVEPGHRLLEDQADVLAAGPAQPVGRAHRPAPRPGAARCPSTRRAAGEQADQAAAHRRLAAARLAHQPEALARCQHEVDAVDRDERSPRGGVGDPQVRAPRAPAPSPSAGSAVMARPPAPRSATAPATGSGAASPRAAADPAGEAAGAEQRVDRCRSGPRRAA